MRSTLWVVLGLGLMRVTAVWAQPMAAPGADVPGPPGVEGAPLPGQAPPRPPAQHRAGFEAPQQLLEADVRAFFALLNGKRPVGAVARETEVVNFYELAPYVADGRDGYFGANEWFAWWPSFRGSSIELTAFAVEEIQGQNARVRLTYHYEGHDIPNRLKQTLALRWNGNAELWQFVPEVPQKGDFFDNAPLRWATYMVAQPPGAVARFREMLTQQKLYELVKGTQQFRQDWDERFAFEPDYVEEALRPYLPNESVWMVPGHQGHYRFNARLSGKSENEVRDLELTIVFYEGENEKPVFRYGGKAAIGLADGNVKLVNAKELEGLRWEP